MNAVTKLTVKIELSRAEMSEVEEKSSDNQFLRMYLSRRFGGQNHESALRDTARDWYCAWV